MTVNDEFDKRKLDETFVKQRERLVTRGWRRLHEVAGTDIPIIEFPLPEVIDQLQRKADAD